MSQYLPKITANFQTSLAANMAIGATTGTLQSAVDSDGATLATGRYFLTIDRDNGSLEFISCTLTGTALTNVKHVTMRGVESAGTTKTHRVGANVIISDFAVLQMMLNVLDGTTSFDSGTPLKYDGQPTLSDPTAIPTVQFVLDTATGGTVTFSNQMFAVTAGETLAVGSIVYFKESDQRWWKADADVTATFDQVQLGVSQGIATAGNGVTVLVSGLAANFSALTAGTKYYLSNTAGGVTTSAAQTTTVFLGVATNTTTIKFTPQAIYAPTKLEKDALAGLSYFTGAIVPTVRRTAPSGWYLCDGSAVSRTGATAALFAASVPTAAFTVTIASPAVCTSVAHGLVEGDIVHFTTTGALPTGLAAATEYYVIATGLTADAFRLSATRGGAAINTTGSQSGVHTFFAANDGMGDGSTTFNLPNIKGKTVYGYDTSNNKFDVINVPNTYAGEETHTLTTAELPTFSLSITASSPKTSVTDTATVAPAQQGAGGTGTVSTSSVGSGTAHNNLGPYTVRNWLIKA